MSTDGSVLPLDGHTELPTDALALGAVALGATALLPSRRRRP